jgi:hypothetical protein
MDEYFTIKLDRSAYEVALAILRQEFAFMRNLTYTHAKYAQLERAIGAFYAAPLINNTTKTQHT